MREVHDLVFKGTVGCVRSGLGLGEAYWCIERLMCTPPTVFVHTSEQAAALELSPLRDRWDDAYFELAKANDEFGYLDRRTTLVQLDIKEDFDGNYASNWCNYWK